jgi:hypothetical protein
MFNRDEWCRALDTYYALTESMDSIPKNVKRHLKLEPCMDFIRGIKKKVTAWFQVVVKTGYNRDIGRLIGLALYNTRFDNLA